MKKPLKPETQDLDNLEWTADTFARARTAKEVLPEIFSEHVSQTLLKPRGRPRALTTKERINIRLSADVLASFRNAGPGWQTRIDAALKDWVKTHSAV